jgi:hypothetical protein
MDTFAHGPLLIVGDCLDVTETQFFFQCSSSLTVAQVVAMTGAEPLPGAELARRLTNIAPIDRAGPT